MQVETVALDYDDVSRRDDAYQKRKHQVTALAYHDDDEVVPHCGYLPEEDRLWEEVLTGLEPWHERWAPRHYLDAKRRARLSRSRIPEMRDLSDWLEGQTGFEVRPVAGFVTPRVFLENLGRRRFLATQYIRHSGMPGFSAEPDYIHEVLGHVILLSIPFFADLSEAFGRAAMNASPTMLERIGNLYWHTVEVGLVRDRGSVRAYGTALLSSADELRNLESASLVSLDAEHASITNFVPTAPQPFYFIAEDYESLKKSVYDCLDEWSAEDVAND